MTPQAGEVGAALSGLVPLGDTESPRRSRNGIYDKAQGPRATCLRIRKGARRALHAGISHTLGQGPYSLSCGLGALCID